MRNFGIALLTWSIIAIFIMSAWTSVLHMELNKPQQFVGDTIVLMNDTLMVTKYSITNREYSLSNGAVIREDLFLKIRK